VTFADYAAAANFYSSAGLDVNDDAASLASFALLEPLEDARVLDLACGTAA
jgi:hypothetical protein